MWTVRDLCLCFDGFLRERKNFVSRVAAWFHTPVEILPYYLFFVNMSSMFCATICKYLTIEFFTIGLSDAFLSDYLTDLKLHRTK